MCCPGCAAVAQAIVESGFSDYYATRTGFAATALEALPPAAALLESVPAGADAGARDEIYSVEAIRCAACVWLIERAAAQVPGVSAALLNVSTGQLHLRRDPQACKMSELIGALRKVGYVVYPFAAGRHAALQERERKKLFRQLFVAGLSMMQVMMYAFPAYVADEPLEADMAALMRWAALLLTLPALLYSAQPFFSGAWRSLRQRMPGMDVPVAIGIGAASVASIAATVRGTGEVYFDSVTMFIFLLLASRFLEQQARRKAGAALERLRNGLPASARQLVDFPASRATKLVAASSLCVGDLLMVAAGETLPADGVIVEGESELDLSLLTGESRAQRRAAGAEAPGGAVNIAQPLVLRVTRLVADSTLARLVGLVEGAVQGKPRLALWADRVASWFVVILLVFALGVFLVWQQLEPARAWEVAIAVLVVSCPCALSLATPAALAAATASLVRRGVLVVQPHVLETLHRCTHVVFDKTGTLTEGKPVLRRVHTFGALDAATCLRMAAALEAGSAHPLASALVAAAASADAAAAAAASADASAAAAPGGPTASGLRTVAGCGVAGEFDGQTYRLGNAAFAGASPSNNRPPPGVASVFLGAGGHLLARFDLADALRPDAHGVVQRFLDSGRKVIILSGDDQWVVDDVARQLGIGTALGAQLPEDKLAYVQQLQAHGAVVAMAGDGVNDAAVLGAADVSFAMGGGAALAQVNADCVLLAGHLSSLAMAAGVADRTLAVVRQNLGWATVYNVIAIPAAALGLLSPWMAAAGMSLSSAFVVINALRLVRGKE